MVTRQAAVIATPGSTSVQTMAVVPPSGERLVRMRKGYRRNWRRTENVRDVGQFDNVFQTDECSHTCTASSVSMLKAGANKVRDVQDS
jgi:hypothetical protein